MTESCVYSGVSSFVGVRANHPRALREGMAGPMRLIVGVTVLGLMALPVAAFQEQTVGGGKATPPAAVAPSAPAVDLPKDGLPTGKKLQLSVPEVSLGGKTGTEVKIPGIGSVGVLPKLDFGLELLYGATDNKSVPDAKADPSDVQIRGTIKHRF